jgi:hypothetical protein
VNARAGWAGGRRVSPSGATTVRVRSPAAPPGFLFAVESTLHLSGTAVAGGPVGGFRVGRAETKLTLFPTDFLMTPPHPGASFAYAVDNLDHSETNSFPAPTEIPIVLLTVNEETATIGLALRVTGQAASSSGITTAGNVLATFEGDFSKTLTWGGITRVTDAETGEEIADWTVASGSGFDYSRPFEVPEPPGSFPSAAVAGLAICCVCRGRSREPGTA